MRMPNGNNHSPRFNPFDDLSTSTENDDETPGQSTTSEITSTASEGSEDVSLAELGLTEDYFAHPEGLFGMSSAEELEAAIENCKKMVLEAREHSERKKKLVNKLIQLRMKLQELKEGPSDVEPKVKLVLGHKLRKRSSNSVKYYCDCCNGLIWGMLQAWYRCRECSFNCHYKCANNIRRKCIAVDLKDRPYTLDITPENGLSAQQFICIECKNPISITGVGKDEARLCDYSGQYFCPQCHWNDSAIIPARVLHNWDFTPQKVSRISYQILSRLFEKPSLNVQKINPLLFNYVEELGDIRKLRQDILLMKEYFVTCNSALDMKLLLKLSSRQHFVDGADIYSLEDLVLAQERTLSDELTNIHAEYAKHIKFDCVSCQAKGFICEICNSGETLFPFDFGVSTCSKCKAVFHRDCFTFSDCPRCERVLKKKERRKEITGKVTPSESEEDELDADYLLGRKISDGSSEVSEDSKPAPEYAPAFTTATPTVKNPSKERSPSSPVDIDDSGKKRHDSSIHNLLTESSYTDYAVLGFTGAGKGRPSVPNIHQTLDAPPNFSKDPEKEADNEVVVAPPPKETGFHQEQRTRIRFDHSRTDQERYESNPITRQRQRDEALFSSLVGVQSTKKDGRDGRDHEEGHNLGNRNGNNVKKYNPPRASGGRLNRVNINDPFDRNQTKGSKFIAEATKATSGTPQNLNSDPDLDPFRRKQKPQTTITTGNGRQRSTKTNQNLSKVTSDPFKQYQSMGSKFIDETTRNSSRPPAGEVPRPQTYDPKLDPFAPIKDSRPRDAPQELYDSELDPFSQTKSSVLAFVSNRKLSPNYTGGNPFGEEEAGNPFGDDRYDQGKNPFSMT